MRHSCHIDVFHLEQHRDRLHAVLESKHRIFSYITESTCEQSQVLCQVSRQLISELQALVQFNFCDDLGCNRFLGEDVGKVTLEIIWINLFDLTSSELDKTLEARYVGFSALDRDKIDHDSIFLRVLTNTVIETCSCLWVTSLEGTHTYICHSVCANDDLRTRSTLSCHRDRCQDSWA